MALAALSVAEVAAMVRDAGYPEAATKMYADQVDGEALALLSTNDFVEYGVKKGPALKLVHQLQLLSQEQPAVPDASATQLAVADTQCTMADLVNAFITHWGLDPQAQQALLQLDPVSQEKVMSTFAPPANTVNLSAVFMGWVKAVASGVIGCTGLESVAPAADAANDAVVQAFILQWGLDSKAQDVLVRLDAFTRQKVMADFAPPDVTRANRMFMGFVKSVAGRIGAEAAQLTQSLVSSAVGGHAALGLGYGDPSVDAFVVQWGLDTKSVEVLVGLDPDTRQRVMGGFAPPNPARANQMFMGFVKSVVQRSGGSMPVPEAHVAPSAAASAVDPAVEAFINQWGLDSQAQEMLVRLDPATQRKVMTDFSPPNVAKANQMFMSFVRGVVSRISSPAAQSTSFGHVPQQTGDMAVDGFIAKWGLDSQALETLCRLDPATQAKVMSDFSPPDPSRANRMFMGFVRSVASRTAAAAVVPTGGGAAVVTGHPTIDAFCAQWGLDSKSQEVLLGLDPATQERVITSFAPPNASRANPMFMGFVKSLVGGHVGPRRPGPY